jgi:hypothetical protein
MIAVTLLFAVLYAIKGGSGNVFKNWNKVRERSKVLNVLMGGKFLSTLIVFLFAALISGGQPELAIFIPLAWIIGVSPSMGEESGAIGRIGEAHGEYIEYFDRRYGILKGIQRGVFMGACMTVATGYVPFILFSLLFVPCTFIGQDIYYRITGKDSWVLAEPLIGALVYGLPMALWLGV